MEREEPDKRQRRLVKRVGLQVYWVLVYLSSRLVPEVVYIRCKYRLRFGRKLRLRGPETFNEKLQWLKLHDRKQLYSVCADKFAVRGFVESMIGKQYLIPLLACTDTVDDIRPDKLPDYPVIIKATHTSGGELIVTNKSDVNWKKARSHFRRLLKENYYFRTKEYPYKKISPRLVVERLLLDEHGVIPNDFKFHCFHGRVKFIQVDTDRHSNHCRNLYDPDWNVLPCRWKYQNGSYVEKPTMLPEMLVLAEQLAANFVFVRVDLYCVREKVFFGELTFYPESGFRPFDPEDWDRVFGEWLQLPV